MLRLLRSSWDVQHKQDEADADVVQPASLQALFDEIAALMRKVHELEQQQDSAKEQAAGHRALVLLLTAQLRASQDLCQAAQRRLFAAGPQLQEATNRASSLDAQLQEASSRTSTLEAQLQQARAAHQAETAALDRSLTQHEQELSVLHAKAEELDKQRNELDGTWSAMQRSMDVRERELAEKLASSQQEVEQKLHDAQEQWDNTVAELQRQLTGAKAEVARLQAGAQDAMRLSHEQADVRKELEDRCRWAQWAHDVTMEMAAGQVVDALEYQRQQWLARRADAAAACWQQYQQQWQAWQEQQDQWQMQQQLCWEQQRWQQGEWYEEESQEWEEDAEEQWDPTEEEQGLVFGGDDDVLSLARTSTAEGDTETQDQQHGEQWSQQWQEWQGEEAGAAQEPQQPPPKATPSYAFGAITFGDFSADDVCTMTEQDQQAESCG